MRFSVVASALFAGYVAATPVVTMTIESTQAVTITSCGPEVTNCPATSKSTSVVSLDSTPPAAVSTSMASVSSPVAAANNTTMSAAPSTVTIHSTQAVTITSCAADVTDCPSASAPTMMSPPFAMNSTSAAYMPTGTGASVSATYSVPASYTGAASNLNAGMALAGFAGFAALLI